MPKKPIVPGETAAVVLRYDKSGSWGEFERTAVVQTNDAVDPTLELVARGNMGKPGWTVEPNAIWPERLFTGSEYYALLAVYPPNDQPWRVSGIESDVNGITVGCEEIGQQALAERLTGGLGTIQLARCRLFRIKIQPSPEISGRLQGELRLCLEGASAAKLPIPFSTKVVTAVKPFPETIFLAKESGHEINETISLVSLTGDAFSVVSAKTGIAGISATYPEMKAERIQVELKGIFGLEVTGEKSVELMVDMAGRRHTVNVQVILR